MSRLIDADALNAALYHEAFETDTDMQKWDSGCWIRYKMFEQAVKAAPTIEAEPVRHGQWILPDVCYEDIECSVCHAYMPLPISFDYRPTYKYCPMCGAKMDEVTT